MRNVLRKMRALLREPQRGAVGVSLTDGGICLTCLAGTEEFQRREETLHLPLPPTEAKESLWQETAGVIQVALAKRGWEKSRIAVCLTEDEVFSYSREFPPLSEREMPVKRRRTRWIFGAWARGRSFWRPCRAKRCGKFIALSRMRDSALRPCASCRQEQGGKCRVLLPQME